MFGKQFKTELKQLHDKRVSDLSVENIDCRMKIDNLYRNLEEKDKQILELQAENEKLKKRDVFLVRSNKKDEDI